MLDNTLMIKTGDKKEYYTCQREQLMEAKDELDDGISGLLVS